MIESFAEKVGALLGKSVETPEVKAFLAELGVVKPLSIDRDVGGAYVKRPSLGVDLFFQDPARTSSPACAFLPHGILVLFYCFYFTDKEGYSPFSGGLPRGLSFSDSRDAIVHKLGPPSWRREKQGRTVSEQWHSGTRSLSVTYTKDGAGIKTLGFGLPEA